MLFVPPKLFKRLKNVIYFDEASVKCFNLENIDFNGDNKLDDVLDSSIGSAKDNINLR